MTLLTRTQISVLAGFGALTPLAIDMYLPALPELAADLDVSVDQAAQSVSVFLIGLAGAQLISGPLSDRFGRKPVILTGLLMFVASSVIAATTGSFLVLLAARFAQALGASTTWVAGRAVVRDMLDHRESARFFSLLALIGGLAPVLAPLIGAAVILVADWRAIFWIMASFGVLILWGLPSLGESRSAETADNSRREHPFRAYGKLLSERELLGYLMTTMFSSGAFLAYVANSSVVMVSGYGLTAGEFSLIFAANSIALIAGAQLNRALLKTRDPYQVLRISSLKGMILAAALFLFAATEIGGLWTLAAILFLMAGGRSPVQANATAGGLAVDPLRAGSASALLGSAAFIAGAATSWVAGMLSDGTGRGLCLVIGCCLIGESVSIRMLILRRGQVQSA